VRKSHDYKFKDKLAIRLISFLGLAISQSVARGRAESVVRIQALLRLTPVRASGTAIPGPLLQGDIAVAKLATTFMEARASKRLRSVRTIDDANFRQIQASRSDHVISPTKLLRAAIAVISTFVA